MIIFLYGPDSYRSKQKLEEIIDGYKKAHKSGLNLLSLDVKEMDFTDFFGNLRISSMFAEKKLLVVKNIFSNKKFSEDFLGKIKEMDEMKDIVVVHEQEEVDQRLKLFKVLIKECKCQEFGVLDGKALRIWTGKEFEKYQSKINMDALEMLLQYAGNNLWKLEQEIKKLALFKSGASVKKEDVELMIKPTIETDIFKTIDALAQKNKKQAIALVHKHLDNGEAPLYLLSMIGYQIKNLLIVKELAEKRMMYASIVKKSGLHPFVVKKNYFQCNQFSFPELKKIYRTIFETDLNIKTGKIEPEAALELLISSI